MRLTSFEAANHKLLCKLQSPWTMSQGHSVLMKYSIILKRHLIACLTKWKWISNSGVHVTKKVMCAYLNLRLLSVSTLWVCSKLRKTSALSDIHWLLDLKINMLICFILNQNNRYNFVGGSVFPCCISISWEPSVSTATAGVIWDKMRI